MIGIIGGTGLGRIEGLEIIRREMVRTPYGPPSCPILFGRYGGADIAFLARHGATQRIPPHLINYQANIYALSCVGVTSVVAVSSVCGIDTQCQPGSLAVPDQLIDYTQGRGHSFFDPERDTSFNVDFSEPYSQSSRQMLLGEHDSAEARPTLIAGGCYGAVDGPRWPTRAEVARMARDGCTLYGMTGMPEAALARELDIDYACLAAITRHVSRPDIKDAETALSSARSALSWMLRQSSGQ